MTMTQEKIYSEQEQCEAKQAQEWWDVKDYDKCMESLNNLKQSVKQNDTRIDARVQLNTILVSYKRSQKENKIQELKKQLAKQLKSVQKGDEPNYNQLFYNLALISYMLHQINDIEEATKKTLNATIDSLSKVKCCLLAAQSLVQLHDFERAELIFQKLEKMKKEDENKEGKHRLVFNQEEQLSLEMSERVWRIVEWQRCIRIVYEGGKDFGKQLKEMKKYNKKDSSILNRHQVAFLKAMFSYSQGELSKSFQTLSLGLHRKENDLETLPNNLHHHYKALYHNNSSIVLFGMGKFALAAQNMKISMIENKNYLTAGCNNNSKNGGNKNMKSLQVKQQIKPLHVISKNRKLKIMYNYGVTLLHHGFSSHAFDFLIQAAHIYSENPKLWLRLAECCIQKCTGCGKDESKASSKKSPTLMYNTHQEIGAGIHRKIQIKPINNYLSNSKHNLSFSSNPAPSMEFAMICLRNAYYIIRRKLKGEVTDDHEFKYDLHDTSIQCQPSRPVSGKQLVQLVADVLTNSAYVSLHLGDASTALMFAKYVLSMKEVSPMHKYLASTYLAEAQTSVEKLHEAINHLNVDNIGNIEHFFKPNNNGNGNNNSEIKKENDPYKIRRQVWEMRNSQIPWHLPDTILKARSYMKFNLAVVQATRGAHDTAQGTLLEAWKDNTEMLPPHAVLLSAYLNLQLNKDGEGCDKALQVLFQHKLEPDPLGCPYSHTTEMSSVGYKLHVPIISNKDQSQRSKSVTPAAGQQQGKDGEGKPKKEKTKGKRR